MYLQLLIKNRKEQSTTQWNSQLDTQKEKVYLSVHGTYSVVAVSVIEWQSNKQSEELVVLRAINNKVTWVGGREVGQTEVVLGRDTSDECGELRDLQEQASRQQLQYIDAGGRKSSSCREWWLQRIMHYVCARNGCVQ